MTEKKFETLFFRFSFDENYGEKDIESLKKKVTTWAKNAPCESTVSVLPCYNRIQFIVVFDVTDNYYDVGSWCNSKLQRLIDSHKQPATCQWANSVWTSNNFGKEVTA